MCRPLIISLNILTSLLVLKVFVEYADTTGAAKAKASLHGRRFGGNSVVAVYYPEDKFAREDFGG